MIRRLALAAFTIAAIAGISGCANMSSAPAPGPGGWITLINLDDGLQNLDRVGSANWRVEDGMIVADAVTDKTPGYLVTRNSYKDFMIRAEFWVSDDANSGIFMRCADVANISDKTCYEANIFDKRPDPSYGTGAIVGVAKIAPMPIAGGKWNLYEITVKGPRMTLFLNGLKTVEAEDSRLASGPIALQYGAGTVKWRKVQVKPLP